MSQVGWVMPYSFPWLGVILTVVVGIGFGVVAALIPARSAARLDVVDALHHELGAVPSGRPRRGPAAGCR